MKLKNVIFTLPLFLNTQAKAGVIFQCDACPAGTYSDGTFDNCVSCKKGYISTIASTICKPCATGHYCTTANADSETKCPIGTYNSKEAQSNSSACIACDGTKGEYQNEEGQASCKACPNWNSHSICNNKTGVITSCAAGYYLQNGTCQICGKGKYVTNGQCVDCPAGTYNPNEGATSCSYCPDYTATAIDVYLKPGTYTYTLERGNYYINLCAGGGGGGGSVIFVWGKSGGLGACGISFFSVYSTTTVKIVVGNRGYGGCSGKSGSDGGTSSLTISGNTSLGSTTYYLYGGKGGCGACGSGRASNGGCSSSNFCSGQRAGGGVNALDCGNDGSIGDATLKSTGVKSCNPTTGAATAYY